ncbi:hypothetical protein AF332_27900, partial [Sporosarcina globispora]
ISGTTVANATITVKSGSVVIATGKADSNGIFSIKIKQQKAGTELSVYAKDKTGIQSETTKVKVLDRKDPNAPKDPEITSFIIKNREVQIKGTAEANTTIIVKINNREVTKVKVSSKGTFSVKLSNVSKGNNKITLQAIDKAGNKSNEVDRYVTIK